MKTPLLNKVFRESFSEILKLLRFFKLKKSLKICVFVGYTYLQTVDPAERENVRKDIKEQMSNIITSFTEMTGTLKWLTPLSLTNVKQKGSSKQNIRKTICIEKKFL